ncbi:MAG: type VI secretion system baseplate subunit TssG [Polyangiaceae bacterium]
MGAEERPPLPDLSAASAQIEKDARRYAFFKLVYLLERVYPSAPPVGHDGPVAAERVRIRPDASMAFPANDVSNVERIKGGDGIERTRVTATFMGLYGSSSPLPNYFIEQVAQDEYQGQAQPVREILDLIHHRLYALIYRSWAKYRFGVSYRTKGDDVFTKRMFCAAGIDGFGGHTPPIERFLFLRYAPLLAMKTRSARGLGLVLNELFGKTGVRIDQFIGAWTLIEKPYRNKIGVANSQLGTSLTIGRYVFDASSRYKIVLGPLDYNDYLAFLPGGHKRPLLRGVCSVFTRGMYDVMLELHVKPDAAPRFQLGAPRASTLKRTAWLGGSKGVPFVLNVPLDEPVANVNAAEEDDDRGEPPPNPYEDSAGF